MSLKRSISVFILALTLVLCAAVRADGAPAFVNAEFDTDLSGWTVNDYTSGGYKVNWAKDADNGAAFISVDSVNDVRICQEISVQEDTVYRISCMVKTEGIKGGAGANIGILGVAVRGGDTLGDTSWHQIELIGRTAKGQKTMTVTLGVGGYGAMSTGSAWFDSVRIEPSDADDAGVMLGTASGKTSNKDSKDNTSQKTSEDPTEFPTGEVLLETFLATAFFLVFYFLHRYSANKPLKLDEKSPVGWIVLILVSAFLLRVALSFIFYGHKTDIACFTAWGRRLYQNGPAHFYEQWCDYPPGYMLILGGMAAINDLVNGNASVYALLVKLPCIIADLFCAYLVWRYAKKTMSRNAALMLMAVVAFTPVMAYVSSAWGQIDQALTVTLIVPILLLQKRKTVLAGLIYGLGIIMKPQALMLGPIFAAACVMYIVLGNPHEKVKLNRGVARLIRAKQDSVALRVTETVLAVIAAFAVIILISIPFKGEQGTFWLVEKYFNTATSYKFATVNGYNFWALIGANWKKIDTPFAGLTYGTWGTIFMALFVTAGIVLFVVAMKKHNSPKGALPLTMAYTLAGIFTFGHYMHERYVFPVLMLLMFAYLFYNDRRLLVLYVLYAATMLLNCIAAFNYSKLFDLGLYWDERIIFWCSLANVIIFALFTWFTLDLVIRNKPKRGYNG